MLVSSPNKMHRVSVHLLSGVYVTRSTKAPVCMSSFSHTRLHASTASWLLRDGRERCISRPPIYLGSLFRGVSIDAAGNSWESNTFQPIFLAEQQGILFARHEAEQANTTDKQPRISSFTDDFISSGETLGDRRLLSRQPHPWAFQGRTYSAAGFALHTRNDVQAAGAGDGRMSYLPLVSP